MCSVSDLYGVKTATTVAHATVGSSVFNKQQAGLSWIQTETHPKTHPRTHRAENSHPGLFPVMPAPSLQAVTRKSEKETEEPWGECQS